MSEEAILGLQLCSQPSEMEPSALAGLSHRQLHPQAYRPLLAPLPTPSRAQPALLPHAQACRLSARLRVAATRAPWRSVCSHPSGS